MSETQTKNVTSTDRRIFEVVLALAVLLLLVAIGTPNLMRSREAAEKASRIGRLRAAVQAGDDASASATEARKVARTMTLDVIAKEPSQVAQTVGELVSSHAGYVQSSDTQRSEYGDRICLVLRVPNDQLDSVVAEIRRWAFRVESEKLESKDVTAEWVDLDARLRNAHREEEQYLGIMRRAGSVKDTVDAAEKLAAVRQRIEQMQGQLNLLNHQVDMATISITLRPEILPQAARFVWHPWPSLRTALVESGQGLADYTDSMLAFLVKLPVIGLWVITVIAIGSLAIRLLIWNWFRWIRRIFQAPKPALQS
jgi:type II secretory pathway pseudopilin PulG